MHHISQVIKRAASIEEIAIPDGKTIAAACERFCWQPYHEGLGDVMPAAMQFRQAVLDNIKPARWLTLLGPSGCGKTHLLKQLFRELADSMRIKTATGWRGAQAAHIIPAEDLTDYQAPRAYGAYDLLYVEDIASGADSRAGAGAVLRSRVAELLQLRSGRWTMLCANLTVGEVASTLDSRIASRLRRDGSWLVVIPETVPDFWWINPTGETR